MPEATTMRGRRPLEYAALAAALALAVGAVAAFVLLSGESGDALDSPREAVTALYAAAAADDWEALRPLLVPELRDEATRASVAFATTQFAPSEGSKVTFRDLQVRTVNDEQGWASVAVTGEFQADNASLARPLEETIYLRHDGDRWRIASQSLFYRAFQTRSTPAAAPAGVELGPLGPQRPKVGEPAPDFALLDARDGTTVRKLSDYRGQVVIVNWYASWCGPCKKEIPDFQAAYDQLAGQLVVLGVDYLESRERAIGILDLFKATYPAVLDSNGDVADHYRVGGGLPTTFFVDEAGILRGSQLGYLSTEALVEQLAKLGLTFVPP